jgi:hypothetical protein
MSEPVDHRYNRASCRAEITEEGNTYRDRLSAIACDEFRFIPLEDLLERSRVIEDLKLDEFLPCIPSPQFASQEPFLIDFFSHRGKVRFKTSSGLVLQTIVSSLIQVFTAPTQLLRVRSDSGR